MYNSLAHINGARGVGFVTRCSYSLVHCYVVGGIDPRRAKAIEGGKTRQDFGRGAWRGLVGHAEVFFGKQLAVEFCQVAHQLLLALGHFGPLFEQIHVGQGVYGRGQDLARLGVEQHHRHALIGKSRGLDLPLQLGLEGGIYGELHVAVLGFESLRGAAVNARPQQRSQGAVIVLSQLKILRVARQKAAFSVSGSGGRDFGAEGLLGRGVKAAQLCQVRKLGKIPVATARQQAAVVVTHPKIEVVVERIVPQQAFVEQVVYVGRARRAQAVSLLPHLHKVAAGQK